MSNAIGRLFLSAIFIILGVLDITGWKGTSASMSAHGVPFVPFALTAVVILKLCGGVLLLTGKNNRLAVLALITFMVPATLLFHNFWSASAAEYQGELIQFLKNLAIIGGLLVVLGQDKKS
jgi:putative oxidoreductase